MTDFVLPPEPLEEMRFLFIFTPPNGQSWGMTLEGFQQALLNRESAGFTHFEPAGEDAVPYSQSLDFGFHFSDQVLDGFAQAEPQGAALRDCTAEEAAEFCVWLRKRVLPEHGVLTVNTRPGMEWELPDEIIPDESSAEEITEMLLTHVAAVVEEDEGHRTE